MPHVELLVIEAAFQINNRIILVPDFSVPEGWTNRKETVVVATPDERQFETLADFNMAHFQIGDPVASIEIALADHQSPFRKDERTTSPSAAGSLFPPNFAHSAWCLAQETDDAAKVILDRFPHHQSGRAPFYSNMAGSGCHFRDPAIGAGS